MEHKKLYKTPEAQVVFISPVTVLTASFSSELQSTTPLTDPEDIL